VSSVILRARDTHCWMRASASIAVDDGGTSSLWWQRRSSSISLKLEALYGSFAGEAFGDNSREYVFVACR
jgi:hypothetical protein